MRRCPVLRHLMLIVSMAAMLAGSAAPLCRASAPPETRRAEDQSQRIRRAIFGLGDPDPEVRQAAAKELWMIGQPAVPALTLAVAGDDPEVAGGARGILDDLRMGISPQTPQPVLDAIEAYRSGGPAARQKAIAVLGASGQDGWGPLLRLFVTESDPAARSSLIALLRQRGIAPLVRLAIAAGDDAAAEQLLLAAPDAPDALEDYAALLLFGGRLGEKIAELERAPAGVPQRDRMLARCYRAKGDIAAARAAARRSGEEDLEMWLAVAAGDAAPLAASIKKELAPRIVVANTRESADDVNMRFVPPWLAGDEKGVQAAAAEAIKWVDAHPGDVWFSIESLLLTDQRDAAVELARRHGRFRTAFEVLQSQGRVADALRLAEEADAPALRPDEAGEPREAPQPGPAPPRDPTQVAEERIVVQAMAAQLLWRLGRTLEARALADLAAKTAEDRRDAAARAGPPRPAAPGARPGAVVRAPAHWVWVALANAERDLGRPDRAQSHLITALAASAQGLTPIPSAQVTFDAIYPKKGRQAAAWWVFFSHKFADEDVSQRLARVKGVMDLKADPDEVATWANEIRAEPRVRLNVAGDRAIPAPALPDDTQGAARLEALAQTLYRYGRLADADACIDAAARASRTVNPYSTAGEAAMERRDWEAAERWYSQAARRDPSSAVLVYQRSMALRQAGRTTEADAAQELAKRLPLANEWLRSALAETMRKNGDPAGADEQIDLTMRLCPLGEHAGSNARRLWAGLQARQGRFAAAAQALQFSVVPVFRTNTSFSETGPYLSIPAVIHVWRARGQLQAGDVEAASLEGKRAIDAMPVDSNFAIELVKACDEAKAAAAADALFLQSWQRLQAQTTKYPLDAPSHNNAAWLAVQCGRELPAALAHAKRSVELQPSSAASLDTLAEIYFRLGDREQAVEQMRKCIEIDPNSKYFQAQLKRFTAPPAANEAAATQPSP